MMRPQAEFSNAVFRVPTPNEFYLSNHLMIVVLFPYISWALIPYITFAISNIFCNIFSIRSFNLGYRVTSIILLILQVIAIIILLIYFLYPFSR